MTSQESPRRRVGSVCLASFLLGVALGAGSMLGQSAAAGEPAVKPPGGLDVVVATVGDAPISARDVERLLRKATGGKQVNPAALPVLKAQVLAEIVDRRLVLAYARRTNAAPGKAEIDASVTEVKTALELKGRSLEGYLKEEGITEADLRRQAAWRLVWPEYLARYVTEERLAAYFKEHRREFDGTQVAVSHILLRPAPGAGPQAIDELVRKAEGIQEEITSGKLSFGDAARKYSSGPTAAKGGELGLIARHGAMVESFARAAFALKPGEVSRPVVTPFGVHLIRCVRIKPGEKRLDDVRKEVSEALARQLLDKLAETERRYTAVKFTGAAPYFKPGTRELGAP